MDLLLSKKNILDCCNVRDIVRFEATNKNYAVRGRRHLDLRLRAFVGQFFPDANVFYKVLRSCDAVISGEGGGESPGGSRESAGRPSREGGMGWGRHSLFATCP